MYPQLQNPFHYNLQSSESVAGGHLVTFLSLGFLGVTQEAVTWAVGPAMQLGTSAIVA